MHVFIAIVFDMYNIYNIDVCMNNFRYMCRLVNVILYSITVHIVFFQNDNWRSTRKRDEHDSEGLLMTMFNPS